MYSITEKTDDDADMKIAIIKADDIKAETNNWNTFFELNEEKGVKVSAGIITYSLSWSGKDDYHAWLAELQNSGKVEFWNHGWDHTKWTEGDVTIYEFSGSGYDYQKEHFDDAQSYMESVLGQAPVAFGAPYNKTDEDTVTVLNESSATRLMFGYSSPDGLEDILFAKMELKGEHDGTGQPNYQSFVEEYEQENVDFTALQFHPNSFDDEHFDEYSQIIDFLISEGWTFMLPAEYIAYVESLD